MTQEKDKFICEKLGVCWHDVKIVDGRYVCDCDNIADGLFNSCALSNPDFTSEAGRVQLLKLMEKHEDYFDFINTIGKAVPSSTRLTLTCFIPVGYMTDDTGKFRDEVFKWLGGKE